MGRIFELRIDHCGLKHLFGYPTLNARQTRWMGFLSEYDFEIKYIKGKENQVAIALSRRSHEMHISSLIILNTYLKFIILEATNSDQRYLKIKETLQQGNLVKKLNFYELNEDGILTYIRTIYVPNTNELKNTMMREIHKVPYVGHC
jgi:hypothetical protein